jgi:hypothetical protein
MYTSDGSEVRYMKQKRDRYLGNCCSLWLRIVEGSRSLQAQRHGHDRLVSSPNAVMAANCTYPTFA